MVKRLTVWMVLATMLLSTLLVSCSAAKPAPAATTANTANATQAATASPAAEKIVIPFWMGPPGEQATKDWWETNIAKYNETNKMNVTVDMQYVPTDAWASKLKAAQASGTAPEMVYVDHLSGVLGGQQGLYLPLSGYIDPKLMDDLYPSIRDAITVNGEFYSIPIYVEPFSLLFYRKDLFVKAGLDPNNPPKTWDELISDAEKLTTGDTFGLAISGSADNGWVNYAWEAALGFDLVNNDWSQATVNSEKPRKLLEFYKELYDKGVVPKQPLGPFWDIQPLAEGRVAMQFNGTWAISRLLLDFKDKIDPKDVGIALIPTIDGLKDGDTVGVQGGWGLAIDGKAKHPKEVADVITYMCLSDPAPLAKFVNDGYYAKLSVRKSVDDLLAKDPQYQNKVPGWYDLIAAKVVPYCSHGPLYPWDISAAYATCMDNVLVNGMSIDDALAQCDKDINDIIANKKLAGTNPKMK